MKSKDEFIRRWRAHVAGVIALGTADARRIFTGPLKSSEEFGELVAGLGVQTEQLLGKLYDDLAPKYTAEKAAANGANGHAAGKVPAR